MKNLLLGSILGFFTATAGAWADHAPSRSASPSMADSAVQQNHITQEMTRLTNRLNLTPQQQVTVKAAMEAVVHGRASKTVEQTLHEICSSAQFAAWEQYKAESHRAEAVVAASRETNRLATQIHLTAAQKNQVYAVLYEIDVRARDSFRSMTELNAAQAAKDQAKSTALSKILTPVQWATLQRHNQDALRVEPGALTEARMTLSTGQSALPVHPPSNAFPPPSLDQTPTP